MKLTKVDENIALRLQYNNILLTKALASLVLNSGHTEFALLYEETDDTGNMKFTVVSEYEYEESIVLNHEIKQVATVVGNRIYEEVDFDLESSFIVFSIEFEEECDEEWRSYLCVKIEDSVELSNALKDEEWEDEELAVIEELRRNGIEIDEDLEDPKYAREFVKKILVRKNKKNVEYQEEE